MGEACQETNQASTADLTPLHGRTRRGRDPGHGWGNYAGPNLDIAATEDRIVNTAFQEGSR